MYETIEKMVENIGQQIEAVKLIQAYTSDLTAWQEELRQMMRDILFQKFQEAQLHKNMQEAIENSRTRKRENASIEQKREILLECKRVLRKSTLLLKGHLRHLIEEGDNYEITRSWIGDIAVGTEVILEGVVDQGEWCFVTGETIGGWSSSGWVWCYRLFIPE